MTSRTPSILVVGYGSIGRRHVRNFRALGVTNIKAFRSRGLDTRPLADDERVDAVPSLDDGLRDHPDLVMVTNPSALHLEAARQAIAADCHVFIEKPISHTSAGMTDLLSAARDAKRHIIVGNNFRFHPTVRKARELVTGGAIGRPLTAEFHVGEYLPDFHPWEDYKTGYSARADLGGGVMLTQIHDIDLLYWFFGMPKRVSGTVATVGNLGINVEDLSVTRCEYDRFVANAHQNFLEQPARRYFRISGSDGTLVWDAADGLLRFWKPGKNESDEFSPPEGFERNTMFMDEARNALAVLDGREPPVSNGEDGLAAVRIVEAAKESALRGAAVDLPKTA